MGAHYSHYYQELLNFLSRLVRDRDTACDLTQESYLRLLAVQQSGEVIADPRALLYRTARNLAVDHHRRSALRQHEDIDALTEPDQPASHRALQPEDALSSAQAVRAYAATIDGLPPRCREAFILHVVDGYSQAETAASMGISRSMVEKHIVRGILACRACEKALHGLPATPQASAA